MPQSDTFEPIGERQLKVAPFFARLVPAWNNPGWTDAANWRRIVRNQPIAVICRDTLISFLIGTPWTITARDPNDKQKYTKEVDYHTELFLHLNGDNFETHLDLLCQDLLDTPFGGASEIGRENDDPDGKVLWVQHIDSATLFPTYDYDFPVGQRFINFPAFKTVFFPRHAIERVIMTPRPEIERAGWGMSPPEKIFLAIEMLFRGDRYYANLLLDTPEAGVLDLLDMSKDSAFEWLESFKNLFQGADPFKVPVLYEHDVPAKWIPFGRPPTDLIFDNVSFKYAQIVCAGYGLKISDIGLSKDAQKSLAGVIHSERQTRRTGFAVVKTKTNGYFDRILPPYLKFNWIDQDDESMISKGRARLANAQAYKTLSEGGLLKTTELRGQIAADGLYSIPIDPDDLSGLNTPLGGAGAARPTNFTRPKVAPSMGGEGEMTLQRQSEAEPEPEIVEKTPLLDVEEVLNQAVDILASSAGVSQSEEVHQLAVPDITSFSEEVGEAPPDEL